jgi:hypothetical protein
VAASLGGLRLDDGVKLGEEAVENGGIPGVNLSTAPIDDNTRLLLQIAVGLLGVVGVSIGAQLQLPAWRVGWQWLVHCMRLVVARKPLLDNLVLLKGCLPVQFWLLDQGPEMAVQDIAV